MSGAINLTPYLVTATGTVTNNSTRIAGFSLTNKSTGNAKGMRFYNLADDGSVGTQIMDYTKLGGSGGQVPQIDQQYSGNTGVYFKNGLYCSVDASVVGLLMTF